MVQNTVRLDEGEEEESEVTQEALAGMGGGGKEQEETRRQEADEEKTGRGDWLFFIIIFFLWWFGGSLSQFAVAFCYSRNAVLLIITRSLLDLIITRSLLDNPRVVCKLLFCSAAVVKPSAWHAPPNFPCACSPWRRQHGDERWRRPKDCPLVLHSLAHTHLLSGLARISVVPQYCPSSPIYLLLSCSTFGWISDVASSNIESHTATGRRLKLIQKCSPILSMVLGWVHYSLICIIFFACPIHGIVCPVWQFSDDVNGYSVMLCDTTH